MSVRMRDVVDSERGALRRELLPRRLRAELGGSTVVDTNRGMLVWEPRRVVPTYAVPVGDIAGTVQADPDGQVTPPDSPMIFPNVPFGAHTTPGEPVLVSVGDRTAQGFKPADSGLDGYVVLNFGDFDAWYEEEEHRIGHPRDPYKRIDVLPSSRHITIERDGVVLAETDRAKLLYETNLPIRYYMPAEDVRVPLRDSALRTICAYKGEAAYKSVEMPDGSVIDDIVWYYPEPLNDAVPVRDMVAFYDEKVDVVIDGVRHGRPRTEWS